MLYLFMKYTMFLCTQLWYFFSYIPSIHMSTIFTYVSMKRQTISWVLHTCLACIDFPLPQLLHHFPDFICLNSSTQGISPSTFLSNVLHNPFHLSPLMQLFLLVWSFFAFQGIYIYSLPNKYACTKIKSNKLNTASSQNLVI